MSRGDVLAAGDAPPQVANQFEATIVWMHEEPLLQGRAYLMKAGTRTVSATVAPIKHRINVNTLEHIAAERLELNDIGVCELELDRAIAFEPYADNRVLGGFILIDRLTNNTVGAGLIHFALRRSQNVHWQALDVEQAGARAPEAARRACVLWLTGLVGRRQIDHRQPASRSSCTAEGRHTYLLDGDNVRHGLNKDLGFTAQDRVENIRRVAEVARLMVDAGLIVLVSFISPFRSERRMARALFAAGRVHRGVRRHAARRGRAARRQRAVQEGAPRRAEELHRHRFPVRGAGAAGDPASTPPAMTPEQAAERIIAELAALGITRPRMSAAAPAELLPRVTEIARARRARDPRGLRFGGGSATRSKSDASPAHRGGSALRTG